jgi:predicted RND superfamily exporter protein
VRFELPALARPRQVVAVGLGLTLIAVASLPFVRVESNPLSFLAEDNGTTRDYAAVVDRIGGFYAMEVVLDLPEPWYDPRVAAVVDGLAQGIGDSPAVARVVSPLDVLRQLHRWQSGFSPSGYRLPESTAEASGLLARADAPARGALAQLATSDGRGVRLSAIVDEMEEQRFLDLVADTEAALERLPRGFGGRVTGQVLQLVRAQQTLVETQLRSLALALLLVFACVGAGVRSWRLTGLSVLPNILPLLAAFGLMSALRWPLDPATVTVASIALGIAVDNTAHVLENLRLQLSLGLAERDAVTVALRRVGPAMVVTTATACVGFLSLSTSDFVPLRAFAVLAASSMVVALAGDLLLLPASLVLGRSARS